MSSIPPIHVRGAEVVTPSGAISGSLVSKDGTLLHAGGAAPGPAKDALRLDAEGRTAFPGLINIHDHLVGTWSPKAGRGPYDNVYQWLGDYHDHPVRRERMLLPDPLVIRLGMYRNLLAGTTTVLDHYFRLADDHYADLPVRVVRDFGREWVMRSLVDPSAFPPWGEGLDKELRAAADGRLFVVHIAEGVDAAAKRELAELDRLQGLGKNTLLVHGVGFTEDDIRRVASAGSAVAWCPCSNHFLYGQTADVASLLQAGVTVCLGTDSTVTGAVNLLEELRYARKAYLQRYGRDLGAERLGAMATSVPGAVLAAEGRLGVLEPGARADFILVPSDASSPWERLLQSRPADIDLVVANGLPVLGDPRHESLFQAFPGAFTRVSIQGREKILTGNLPALLLEIRERLGFLKDLHFLPLDR